MEETLRLQSHVALTSPRTLERVLVRKKRRHQNANQKRSRMRGIDKIARSRIATSSIPPIPLWNNKRIPDVYDNPRLDKSSRIRASLPTWRPVLITVVLWCTLIIHADPITLWDRSIIVPGQCPSAEVSAKKPTNALYRINMDGVGSAFDFIRGIRSSCSGKNARGAFILHRSLLHIHYRASRVRVFATLWQCPFDLAVWRVGAALSCSQEDEKRVKSDCNNQRNRGRLEFSIAIAIIERGTLREGNSRTKQRRGYAFIISPAIFSYMRIFLSWLTRGSRVLRRTMHDSANRNTERQDDSFFPATFSFASRNRCDVD